MAGYSDTRQLIIDTLMGRPAGTEIQPEDHQAFALALNDYIRSVELNSSNAFIGFAQADTVPIQSDNGQCFYISTVPPSTNIVYANFIDFRGNPISVTTPSGKMAFVTLIWNTRNWDAQITIIETNWSQVLEDNIASGAVTGTKIASNSIDSSKIINGTIQSNDLNPNAFDETLSISGKITPADVVGSKLTELEDKTPSIVNNEKDAELDISDENGYVLARFKDGHTETKNFNSRNIGNPDKFDASKTYYKNDYCIYNNLLYKFINKHTGEWNDIDVNSTTIYDCVSNLGLETKGLEGADFELRDDKDSAILRLKDGHIFSKYFNSKDVYKNTQEYNIFDYNAARRLPRNVLRRIVETASNGCCTVIWDNYGLPSLMYEIPIMSIGQLDQRFGDFMTPHPAFIVGGKRVSKIYVACFMSSYIEGHQVSWFGLPPLSANDGQKKSFSELKDEIKSKGDGWHLETVYERNLIGFLSLKHNGEKPHGNTYYGRSHIAGFEWECALMLNGKLPGKAESGTGEQYNGAKWVNGTQPISWSHNGSKWGIYDIIGGYHEWCDLAKSVDGQIIIAEDNDFSSEESAWTSTGAYFDIDGKNTILSNHAPIVGAEKLSSFWKNMVIDSSYDSIDLNIRKKLSMLFIASKINSTDENNTFDFDGSVHITTTGVMRYKAGGAEEYKNGCGLGNWFFAYPDNALTSGHNNMGTRMVYIKK